MNTNRSSLFDAVRSGPDDDSEVVRILDAYLSASRPASRPIRKVAGRAPCAAGPLRAYLKVMNLAGELAEDSSVGSAVSFAEPSTAGSTSPSSSLPSTLDFGHGPPPQIHLHELPDDGEPLVMPRSAEMPG